jgi:formylglycine-generating enzyme required for sulfatase activity
MVSAVARSSSTLDRGGDQPPYERDREPIEPESGFKNEILILISAPLLDSDGQPVVALSVQQEVDEIYEALADLDLNLEIVVKIATVETLNDVFSDRRSPLVIHFIGHGMTGADGVALVLEDNVGIAQPFKSLDFRSLFRGLDQPPCQVAFLNACHSAGLADELLNAEVPHVIAINAADTILDQASHCFAKVFYCNLFGGQTVQVAFERGRSAVERNDKLRQQVDPATLQGANWSEALKFRLLPGNSTHRQQLTLQFPSSGRLEAPSWQKTNLGRYDPNFMGRQSEIHKVAKLVDGGVKCVALHGMGGIGKTSVAQAIGRWQHEREKWRDGVWFVDLRNVDRVEMAKERLFQAIERNNVSEALRNCEMLLILDDLDVLLEQDDEVDGFVRWLNALLRNPSLGLLLTSRKTLPDDVNFELIEIHSTGPEVARQIFGCYAPQQATWGSSADLDEVLQSLDGYPLALKIAAAYLKTQRCSLQDLRTRLEASFPKVLGGSSQYPKSKDRSLIASLNLSHGVLPPDAKEMFSHLALFPGGLTGEAAQYIFGVDAWEALETLLFFSMAEKSQTHWRLPEPARQYALDQQSANPIKITTYHSKTLGYFHHLLAALEDSAVAGTIAQHQINLKHFLHWGYDHELGDRGVCRSGRITALLAGHWRSLSPGEDPLVAIERALVAAERCHDKLAVGDLWKAKGDRQLAKQGLAVAQESYQQSIARYESIGIGSLTIVEQAEIQQKLGAVWEAYPNSVQAEVFYLRAFELYESAGALLQAAGIKVAIGDLQRDAKQLATALVSYQEALEIYQSQSDRSGIRKAEGRIRQLQGFVENLETSAPFEVVTVDAAGEVITRQQHTAQYFREILPGDVALDMISIPTGEFLMGSPPGEWLKNEQPQHLVKVPAFFMGKYPVTQEQWQAIASQNSLQVAQLLNPSPSYFSDPVRPVEQVSWYDAVEFCARLSKLTGRSYRLASEAEWEYACRAKTDSPFHFGQTITTELATYDGSSTYAQEREDKTANGTTPVGQFPPNIFGLYDMHGNVWEWCQDSYHSSYEGAPTDGSAWIDLDAQNSRKVLRGGSWYLDPLFCRSACRFIYFYPDHHYYLIGFRVVSVAARTL